MDRRNSNFGPFLKWTREELQQMNQRIRKLMMVHKALHLRYDTDRMYMSRREEGRKLASIQDSIDASIQRLEEYINKQGRRLIIVTANMTDKISINRTEITRKQKWEEKQLY